VDLGKKADRRLSGRPTIASHWPAVNLFLGQLLAAGGRSGDAAHEAFRQALDNQKQLVAEFPNRSRLPFELATTHHWLGDLLGKPGDFGEAQDAYLKGLALRKQTGGTRLPRAPRASTGTI